MCSYWKKDDEVGFRSIAFVKLVDKNIIGILKTFSTEVITPIKRLDINLNHIYYDMNTIFTQKTSSSPMNTRTGEPEKHQCLLPFHWHIDNPELHFEYRIFW